MVRPHAEHDNPKGWARRIALAYAKPLARRFTVYSVNRDLEPGELPRCSDQVSIGLHIRQRMARF